MSLISKLQPIIIIACALLGVLIGQLEPVASNTARLIEPFLMVMLFGVFLGVDFAGLKRSFSNFRFALTSVAINFVWTPALAMLLAVIFLADSNAIQIGFIMLLITPCTDWYIVFTGLARGNIPLSASILPLNLILQIVLMPVYLLIFMGSLVAFDVSGLLLSIAFVLLIPFAAATLVRLLLIRKMGGERFEEKVLVHNDNFQFIFLNLAIVAMFASQARQLVDNPIMFVKLFIPLMIFFILTFFLSGAISRFMRFPRADGVSLIFTTLARNSPLSLAIAVAAFPDQPLIALALVIGPLIELPVLALAAKIITAFKLQKA